LFFFGAPASGEFSISICGGSGVGSTTDRLVGNRAGVTLRKVRASSWFSVAAFIFLMTFKVLFMSLSEGHKTVCVPTGKKLFKSFVF